MITFQIYSLDNLILQFSVLAKSMFMSCLTKLNRSYYAVGSSSTKSGIFEYLCEHRPKYLMIDEIEKMSKRDQVF